MVLKGLKIMGGEKKSFKTPDDLVLDLLPVGQQVLLN